MKNIYAILLATLVFACDSNQEDPDAYGNFEAVEVKVSAMTAGKLLELDLDEGNKVEKGEKVGLIDTTTLHLKKEQLKASYQAVMSRKPGILTQRNVLIEQKKVADKELERFKRLAEEGATAQKQVDDLKDKIAVLDKQIKNIEAQYAPLTSELKVIETQIAQIDQQIKDSKIVVPISGTVLTKIAEPHELVAVGSPLFRIANLDTLILKAYISGSQLNSIKLGQSVEVMIDKDKEINDQFSGTVSWISSMAEFTPKTIQTKDERTDQVYAIKIVTPNPDGTIKIGMPGEVIFSKSQKK